MYGELSESERFPLLSEAGGRFLRAMRQDASAPRWNWPNGEQLDAAGLATVRDFAARLRAPRSTSDDVRPAREPGWLAAFVDFCLTDVPFYRRRASAGTPFASIPSCERADLSSRPWEFVPDSQSLDRLIVFSSSGTTGHPARLPTHPATAACGVPLLEQALATVGSPVVIPRGVERMALSNLTDYCGAYTTAIVVSYLDEAGCVRVNLRDEDWRRPADRGEYLARWRAPVLLSDPQAFVGLLSRGLAAPPDVMISSVMHLSDGLAAALTREFGCPVLDVYALTEAGIVSVKTERGHVVLPPDLHVEVLDEHDQPCRPGERGEVTLTGGRNPFAPLLRYRTGDYAALTWIGDRPVLVDLEGRAPVTFATRGERRVHSMEVSRRLRSFPLAQYQLHQDSTGAFVFRWRGPVDAATLREALDDVLDRPERLTLESLPAPTSSRRKIRQYVSDVPV